MKKAVILTSLLSLTGCVAQQTETIFMAMAGAADVKCGPYPTDVITSEGPTMANQKLRACVSDFQRQGYNRVSPPSK